MGKKVVWGVFGLVIIASGTFLLFSERISNKSGSSLTPPPTTSAPAKSFSIVLREQNNSSQAGIATIDTTDKKTVINLKLVGFPNGIEQKAYVGLGSCSKASKALYQLENVVNGESQTRLEVGVKEFLGKTPLVIVVGLTSCGEILLK